MITQTKKLYYFSSRDKAVELAKNLLADENVTDINFEERTWLKADDPERFRITVTFHEETIIEVRL